MKRSLGPFWTGISTIIGVAFVALSCYQVFALAPNGFVLQENSYYYALVGLALAQVYIHRKPYAAAPADRVVWYDILLAALSLALCLFFAWNGYNITIGGWMFAPPNDFVSGASIVLPFLVLEALRRCAGKALLAICAFFMVYPAFADHMPSFLEGQSLPLATVFTFHSLSPQSLIGIPMQVVGSLLIGYIVFGIVLAQTGGGKFFLDLSFSALGRYRGGAGKVAVIASALFGSISGSAVSNVITIGGVTIPAMKRSGFPAQFAGAIEACASTGGVLMPPIMGAAAFLMAQFLEVPYLEVAIAAIVPSLLYYFGLLIQLDSLAARQNIKGLDASEIPSARKVFAAGWPFAAVFAVLGVFLFLRREEQAPYFAVLFVFLCLALRKSTRLKFASYLDLLAKTAGSIADLTVTIGAVGFIIGSMSLTGIGASISGELVALAGGNVYLMLIMGALASFILGMGMTTSACYIFLAIVLAPGLVAQGFNQMCVHMFILYWAMTSNITPPVGMACFPAAAIAEAPFMRVGKNAMTFGFVLYLIPFVFVIQPAMLFQNSTALECIYYIFTAFLGVFVAASAIGRYMAGVGPLPVMTSVLLVPLGLVLTGPFSPEITAVAVTATVALLFWQKRRNTATSALALSL